MNDLRVIAITHRQFPLETVGSFYLQPEVRNEWLQRLKASFGMHEVMYLATCNRVEIVFTLDHFVCPGLTARILQFLRPEMDEQTARDIAGRSDRYNGAEAMQHLLRVAASLESVVIGEREIITQLRTAYEHCLEAGLTGDDLRLVVRQCVKTAKEIFTHTDLSKKPVSVVSLAWQQFRDRGISTDARIVLIGAGQIIRNFCKFLFENGYSNLVIANRTKKRAEELTAMFGGHAASLEELAALKGGFDVLVSCTGSDHAIVDTELYTTLLDGDHAQKVIIDLALPADIHESVLRDHPVYYVGMQMIQEQASTNIAFREQALTECEAIIETGLRDFERTFSEREVERAMRSIPDAIKEIRSTATGSVFAKDLEKLDSDSRELLEKILTYMEKKYISVPMKMAREVLLDAVSRN